MAVLNVLENIAWKFLENTGLGNSKLQVLFGKIRSFLKKTFKLSSLDTIEINLAQHCNLSCYSCNHFSPLAKTEFADLETTKRDLERLKILTKGNIYRIYLVGGEPLLNQDIVSFMKISRELFPKSRIQIITNGLLLINMKQEFWKACNDHKIIMTPTKYPGINWEKIENKASEYNYKFSYFGATDSSEKVSRKFALDLTGAQDMNQSFAKCCLANCTVTLYKGRLSTCTFVSNMRHFNSYFKQNIPVTDNDSIDIYKAKSVKEITGFLASPIDLCRYCKSIGDEIVGEWSKSKKEITEWT